MVNQYDGKLTHQQQREALDLLNKDIKKALADGMDAVAGALTDLALEVNEARSVEDVAEGVPPLAYVGRHRNG